jgi:hypothetical protein
VFVELLQTELLDQVLQRGQSARVLGGSGSHGGWTRTMDGVTDRVLFVHSVCCIIREQIV